MIKKVFKLFAGKKKFQFIFQFLFSASLKGLNYGNGTFFDKSGELYVLKWLQKKWKSEKNLVLFDVGANVGKYAQRMYDVFRNSCTIYSFEPSGVTYNLLLQTVASNKNIHAFNFGFSDSEQNGTLYSNGDGSGIASVYKRKLDHFGTSMNQNEEIQLSTIDSFCKKNNIDKIHFLKIDVEGHEINVLQGANEMISGGKIDYIQFEFGGCNIDSRTYFQNFYYLLHDKYKIYRILVDGLYEITSYTEDLEIFITVNYLAEKK